MAGYIGSKAAVVSSGAERKKTFDITGTTTSLTGLSYTVNQVHVFHNGVRLVDGTDFTATNGSSITLTSAAESGDEVVVISYATFQAADAYTKAEADAEFVSKDGDTITTAAGTTLTLDRTGSDGTILDLKKDGSTVGSIGAEGGDFYVTKSGSNQTGIYFNELGMLPMTSGSISDNSRDIGQATYRFKDLYLSGGVYLGGTGSANKLDDVESGTFTPTVWGAASAGTTVHNQQQGFYEKVGNVVNIMIGLSITSMSGTGSIKIGGLPFAAKNAAGYEANGSVMYTSLNIGSYTQLSPYIPPNTAAIDLFMSSSNQGWTVAQAQNDWSMRITITYQV